MKELWVDVRPWKKELATTAIESGADALVVECAGQVRELGRMKTIAPDGDLILEREVFECTIKGKQGENEALAHAREGYVIVHADDWTVIPLENLVSRSDRIVAAVCTEEEVDLALQVLERGVCGLCLKTDDPAIIRAVAAKLRSSEEKVNLVPFTISAIRQVGMGDRVCVDTCSLLSDGEGMLIGNTSSGFLLVHAETLENPYVSPRPFRVNAGAVHAYIMMPGGKTAYLSDLKVGDPVLVADREGEAREVTVGRVKIERRPMLLVEGVSGETTMSLILQNAETIRLVGEDGKAKSVVDVSVGDRVLGVREEGGRHFGVAIKEHIREK
jgi:3-dehydroquinate synthase II